MLSDDLPNKKNDRKIYMRNTLKFTLANKKMSTE